MKTALIMAMKEEARPVIEDFGMVSYSLNINSKWANQVYQSKKYPDFFLITNGQDRIHPEVSKVGTQAAALSAFIAIEVLGVDQLINAGTAGGFESRSTKIGDVFLCTKAFYHDRRVPISEEWNQFAKGSYILNSDSTWLEKYELRSGIVSSGNSLDFVDRDLEIIHQNGAHVKEMEAAAIAELCCETDIPLTVIKSITDIVDGGESTEKEFIENLQLASERLSKVLLNILHGEYYS